MTVQHDIMPFCENYSTHSKYFYRSESKRKKCYVCSMKIIIIWYVTFSHNKNGQSVLHFLKDF